MKRTNCPYVAAIFRFQYDDTEKNKSLLKDLSMGGFNEEKMKKFAVTNNLELRDYKISNLKQNDVFTEGLIKRIFLTKQMR